MRLSCCWQYILSQCYVMTKFMVNSRTDAKTSSWRGRSFTCCSSCWLFRTVYQNVPGWEICRERPWNSYSRFHFFFFTFPSSCSVLVSIATFFSSSFQKLENWGFFDFYCFLLKEKNLNVRRLHTNKSQIFVIRTLMNRRLEFWFVNEITRLPATNCFS